MSSGNLGYTVRHHLKKKQVLGQGFSSGVLPPASKAQGSEFNPWYLKRPTKQTKKPQNTCEGHTSVQELSSSLPRNFTLPGDPPPLPRTLRVVFYYS